MAFSALVNAIVKSIQDPDNHCNSSVIHTLKKEIVNDLTNAYVQSEPLVNKYASIYAESKSFLDFILRFCDLTPPKPPLTDYSSLQCRIKELEKSLKECREQQNSEYRNTSPSDHSKIRELQQSLNDSETQQRNLRREIESLKNLLEKCNEKKETLIKKLAEIQPDHIINKIDKEDDTLSLNFEELDKCERDRKNYKKLTEIIKDLDELLQKCKLQLKSQTELNAYRNESIEEVEQYLDSKALEVEKFNDAIAIDTRSTYLKNISDATDIAEDQCKQYLKELNNSNVEIIQKICQQHKEDHQSLEQKLVESARPFNYDELNEKITEVFKRTLEISDLVEGIDYIKKMKKTFTTPEITTYDPEDLNKILAEAKGILGDMLTVRDNLKEQPDPMAMEVTSEQTTKLSENLTEFEKKILNHLKSFREDEQRLSGIFDHRALEGSPPMLIDAKQLKSIIDSILELKTYVRQQLEESQKKALTYDPKPMLTAPEQLKAITDGISDLNTQVGRILALEESDPKPMLIASEQLEPITDGISRLDNYVRHQLEESQKKALTYDPKPMLTAPEQLKAITDGISDLKTHFEEFQKNALTYVPKPTLIASEQLKPITDGISKLDNYVRQRLEESQEKALTYVPKPMLTAPEQLKPITDGISNLETQVGRLLALERSDPKPMLIESKQFKSITDEIWKLNNNVRQHFEEFQKNALTYVPKPMLIEPEQLKPITDGILNLDTYVRQRLESYNMSMSIEPKQFEWITNGISNLDNYVRQQLALKDSLPMLTAPDQLKSIKDGFSILETNVGQRLEEFQKKALKYDPKDLNDALQNALGILKDIKTTHDEISESQKKLAELMPSAQHLAIEYPKQIKSIANGMSNFAIEYPQKMKILETSISNLEGTVKSELVEYHKSIVASIPNKAIEEIQLQIDTHFNSIKQLPLFTEDIMKEFLSKANNFLTLTSTDNSLQAIPMNIGEIEDLQASNLCSCQILQNKLISIFGKHEYGDKDWVMRLTNDFQSNTIFRTTFTKNVEKLQDIVHEHFNYITLDASTFPEQIKLAFSLLKSKYRVVDCTLDTSIEQLKEDLNLPIMSNENFIKYLKAQIKQIEELTNSEIKRKEENQSLQIKNDELQKNLNYEQERTQRLLQDLENYKTGDPKLITKPLKQLYEMFDLEIPKKNYSTDDFYEKVNRSILQPYKILIEECNTIREKLSIKLASTDSWKGFAEEVNKITISRKRFRSPDDVWMSERKTRRTTTTYEYDLQILKYSKLITDLSDLITALYVKYFTLLWNTNYRKIEPKPEEILTELQNKLIILSKLKDDELIMTNFYYHILKSYVETDLGVFNGQNTFTFQNQANTNDQITNLLQTCINATLNFFQKQNQENEIENPFKVIPLDKNSTNEENEIVMNETEKDGTMDEGMV